MKDYITWALIALLGGAVVWTSSCVSAGLREDRVTNKALENLCGGKAALEIMEKDKQIFREYVCLCQQAAKKSDQNLCEAIINSNNSLAILKACGKDGKNTDCKDTFSRRK